MTVGYAPSRNRSQLFVGVGALAVALAAILVTFFVVRSEAGGSGSSPEDAINAYVDAARAKDVDAAKQVLTGEALEDLSDGTEGSVFDEGVELVDFEIDAIDVQGDEATAAIDATFAVDDDEQSLSYTFELERHDGEWKIADATPED